MSPEIPEEVPVSGSWSLAKLQARAAPSSGVCSGAGGASAASCYEVRRCVGARSERLVARVRMPRSVHDGPPMGWPWYGNLGRPELDTACSRGSRCGCELIVAREPHEHSATSADPAIRHARDGLRRAPSAGASTRATGGGGRVQRRRERTVRRCRTRISSGRIRRHCSPAIRPERVD